MSTTRKCVSPLHTSRAPGLEWTPLDRLCLNTRWSSCSGVALADSADQRCLHNYSKSVEGESWKSSNGPPSFHNPSLLPHSPPLPFLQHFGCAGSRSFCNRPSTPQPAAPGYEWWRRFLWGTCEGSWCGKHGPPQNKGWSRAAPRTATPAMCHRQKSL